MVGENRRWGAVVLLLLGFTLSGCGAQSSNEALINQPATGAVGDAAVREWRVDPGCLGDFRTARSRADCVDAGRSSDFTAVALSGGGTKATVFGGEALFTLEAIGWLQQANMISAVSGGSFAAGLYAVSCDPDDGPCRGTDMAGSRRPVWEHGRIMQVLGLGNDPLINEQIARVLIPGVPMVISAQHFGRYIEDRFLREGARGTGRVTMADTNVRRPPLFLSATVVSENRGGLSDTPDRLGTTTLCAWNTDHSLMKRRRSPDEFFHFSFSPLYFRAIGSAWSSYPLGDAVGASAAFPALIEPAILRDWCKAEPSYIRLIDGGANDNQALIEIYATVAELLLHQDRSPAGFRPAPMRDGEDVEALVINSSVTETTGEPGTAPPGRPHELVGFVVGLFDRISAATDTYSGVGFNLRKQLYLHEISEMGLPRRIHPIEISLTELDQYALGGAEAELRRKAGLDTGPFPRTVADLRPWPGAGPGPRRADAPTGPGEELERSLAGERRLYQHAAYERLVGLGAVERARRYHLSPWSPQCYFNIRAELDQSLAAVDEDDQACLREAAGWATVLRAQEQCERAALDSGAHRPTGLGCGADHLLLMPHSDRLVAGNELLKGRCKRLKSDPEGDGTPAEVRCQVLP